MCLVTGAPLPSRSSPIRELALQAESERSEPRRECAAGGTRLREPRRGSRNGEGPRVQASSRRGRRPRHTDSTSATLELEVAALAETLHRVPPHLRRFVVQQDYGAYTAVDHAVWRF